MTKTSKTSKPKRVRRDRTEEILETATELFAKYGFKGATLAQVAEAVELTEAGVIHYFPSKVHLLQGVLEYREKKEIEKYSNGIQAKKKNTTELFQLLEDVVAEGEKVPGLIQLFTVLVAESIRSDHPSHEHFVNRYRRGRDMYVKQFLELNKAGINSNVDPNQLAALIMAVMDGLQIQWLLDSKKVDMVATFRLFSKMVVEYLGK